MSKLTVETMINRIADELNEKNGEFFINGMLNNLHYQVKKANQLIDDVTVQIQDELDKFTGSDVANERLEKRIDFAQQLESQIELLESLADKIKPVYAERAGKAFVPYSPSSPALAEQRKQTAAAADAKAFLERRGK